MKVNLSIKRKGCRDFKNLLSEDILDASGDEARFPSMSYSYLHDVLIICSELLGPY